MSGLTYYVFRTPAIIAMAVTFFAPYLLWYLAMKKLSAKFEKWKRREFLLYLLNTLAVPFLWYGLLLFLTLPTKAMFGQGILSLMKSEDLRFFFIQAMGYGVMVGPLASSVFNCFALPKEKQMMKYYAMVWVLTITFYFLVVTSFLFVYQGHLETITKIFF